jgi:hypothetical protein
MALHDTIQGPVAEDLAAELTAELGGTAALGGSLLIENLDQCTDVTPAWTYCGS